MSTYITCRSALFLVLVLNAAGIRAQESAIPSQLTLDDALHLAIDRNPAIAAAGNEIQAAEGDHIASGKRLNPVFSLQTEDFPIRAHPGPFFQTQAITSRVDYEIETGNRRRLRSDATGLALETKKLAYQDQVRQMRLQVEKVFYQTILAKSNLEASRSILAQTEQMTALNRVHFQQGDLSGLDLNRIEVEKPEIAGGRLPIRSHPAQREEFIAGIVECA
jgi:outer membrane protein, heavy metal efflux system